MTQATRIEVAPKKHADLDNHHEYYLDDQVAQKLISQGRAVELDRAGRDVAPKKAAKPPAKKPTGPAGKPGSDRQGKAVTPPENKSGDGDAAAATTSAAKAKEQDGKAKDDA
jgi:hypothetical protein